MSCKLMGIVCNALSNYSSDYPINHFQLVKSSMVKTFAFKIIAVYETSMLI